MGTHPADQVAVPHHESLHLVMTRCVCSCRRSRFLFVELGSSAVQPAPPPCRLDGFALMSPCTSLRVRVQVHVLRVPEPSRS